MSLVSQLQLAMTRIATEFKSVGTALTAKADKTTTITAGTGLSGGGDLSSNKTLSVVYGTVVGTAAQGNDTRLSDARTPTAHGHVASDIVSGTLANARLPVRLSQYSLDSIVNIADDTTDSGFYYCTNINGALPGGAFYLFVNSYNGSTLISQIAIIAATDKMYMRRKYASAWAPWVEMIVGTDSRLTDSRFPLSHTHASADITQGRLAPGATYSSDLNNATGSGWYYTDANTLNFASGSSPTYVEVVSDGTNVIQTASLIFGGSGFNQGRRRRYKVNGTWQPWFDVQDSLDALDARYTPASTYATDRINTQKVVTLATTANITLFGTNTVIDGVTATGLMRVLVKNQSTSSQNGIYTPSTGNWFRTADADTSPKLGGSTVYVQRGDANAGATFYTSFTSAQALGTAAVPWLPSGDTQWINLTLQNGWVNYDSGLTSGGTGRVCQYRVRQGEVIFRGYCRSGTIGGTMFTMPAGLRPDVYTPNELACATASGNAYGQIGMNAATGAVTADVGTTAWFNLAGLRYLIAGA